MTTLGGDNYIIVIVIASQISSNFLHFLGKDYKKNDDLW